MNNNHVKSVSTKGKNRTRFTSSKQRAKSVTADVYRNYKRRLGVTSAATREEQVHHEEKRKRSRVTHDGAVAQTVYRANEDDQDVSDVEMSTEESNFASELDLALDRNKSEVFSLFHREIWHLVRSLPELLHHLEKIVDLLLAYLVSPEGSPGSKSVLNFGQEQRRARFEINYATTDILHLLGVLARDLRHEIHPYLYEKILPRILHDLLSPPSPTTESGKQPIPHDVSIVEAACRTLAYIFRYDAEALLSESEKEGQEPCLEFMRKYYGVALGHRRDVVRRLTAETFAPLIRKLSDSAKKRHLRRVLRALAASSLQTSTTRMQADVVDGVSCLLFEVARGIKGKLHSKGIVVVKCLLDSVNALSSSTDVVYLVAKSFLERVLASVEVSVGGTIIMAIMASATTVQKSLRSESVLSSALLHTVHLLRQAVRLKRESFDKEPDGLPNGVLDLLSNLLGDGFTELDEKCQVAIFELLCETWRSRPDDDTFADLVCDHLRCIFACTLDSVVSQSNVGLVELLLKDLVAHWNPDRATRRLGSTILAAAAQVARYAGDTALSLVHELVASTRPLKDGPEDTDAFFDLECAKFCKLTTEDQTFLLDVVEKRVEGFDLSSVACCRLTAALECGAFLSLIGNQEDLPSVYQRVGDWMNRSYEVVVRSKGGTSESVQRQHVLQGVILDCFARMSDVALACEGTRAVVLRAVEKILPIANAHVQHTPCSLWAVRAFAMIVNVSRRLDIEMVANTEDLIEALSENLCSPNHFLRLHTLRILASLPQLPFITNQSNLDLSGDFDEEPDSTRNITVESKNVFSGKCDLMTTLSLIESTTLSIQEEKRLVSLISRVEVLGRSCRLPAAYAEAATNHLLGLLHVKFSPVWSAAVRALSALVAGHEEGVWAAVAKSVANFTERSNIVDTATSHSFESEEIARRRSELAVDRFTHYLRWEISPGSVVALFFDDVFKSHGQGCVSCHETADSESVFQSIWSLIAKAPKLLTKYSRQLVPIFIRFLHFQYFSGVISGPDARELRLVDHIEYLEENERIRNVKYGTRGLSKRLSHILHAFSCVKGPQQLYRHPVLESVFAALVTQQDTDVARVAFSCLSKFNRLVSVPYTGILEDLFAKGKFAKTLHRLQESLEGSTMESSERRQLTMLASRILFGRMGAWATGKSTKDSPASRRAATLSFLKSACRKDDDLFDFVYLMLRPYLPQEATTVPLEQQDVDYRVRVLAYFERVEAGSILDLPSSVHQGFLNMLEAVVSQMGFRVVSFIPSFVHVVLALYRSYGFKDRGGESSGTGMEQFVRGAPTRAGTIRALCCRRLAEIFGRFHSVFDFSRFSSDFWDAASAAISVLPETVSSSDDSPSILLLLRVLSEHESLVSFLVFKEHDAIVAVLRCLDRPCSVGALDSVLSFITNLVGEGDDVCGGPRERLIAKHLNVLFEIFSSRFDQSRHDVLLASSGRRAMSMQLEVLKRASKLLDHTHTAVAQGPVESICGSLIGFLDRIRGDESDKLRAIDALQRLIPYAGSHCSIGFFFELSMLLSPDKSGHGGHAREFRTAVASTIQVLASLCVEARQVASILQELNACKPGRVDETDYDVVVPALNALADVASERSWSRICLHQGMTNPSLLTPIISVCFQSLFDEDSLIVRAAYRAIKTLVALASERCVFGDALPEQDISVDKAEGWTKIYQGQIVRNIRHGLTAKNDATRRQFVLLMREVAIRSRHSDSPHLHGDLAVLVREDESDLDFFLNISHVQTHRRSRALQRLRKFLNDPDQPMAIQTQSLCNVLLPLILHSIFECGQKSEEHLVLESIATIGSISRHLPWRKYSDLLWTTLHQVDRHTEQERFVIGLLCSILDAFHFSVIEDLAGNSAVLRALENRFAPKIEALLVKDSKAADGLRSKALRPSVVLALLKLFQKFPEDMFYSRLPRLLTVVCGSLKSKESNERDAARSTLARMVAVMDIKYLPDVVRELAVSLTDGFELHVRSATIHSVLVELARVYSPPKHPVPVESIFDSAVPGIIDLLQRDLFGTAQERKDAKDSRVRFVKEASGSKSYHSLELVGTMIVASNPAASDDDESRRTFSPALNVLVSPFLARLRDSTISVAVVRRIRECLSRVVTGLSRNPSLDLEGVLVFSYLTIEPFINKQQIEGILAMNETNNGSDLSEDDESESAAHLNVETFGTTSTTQAANEKPKSAVSEWRPSMLHFARTSRQKLHEKLSHGKKLTKVVDGSNAPKLTGSHRIALSESGDVSLSNPASVSAVVFSLQLLYSTLKKAPSARIGNLVAMLDPHVPLLTACVCIASDHDILVLSLRCIWFMLDEDLPSLSKCRRSLASRTLSLLVAPGSSSNQQAEILQSSFRILSRLLDLAKKKSSPSRSVESEPNIEKPLSSDQLDVLVSFLRSAVVLSDHQSAALGMIKSIIFQRHISSDLYDLMETLLEQNVRSSQESLRHQSGAIFMVYLLNYPLTKERIDQHLKQMVLNLQYKYADGRLSAIGLVASAIDKLPLPVIEEFVQMLFLPLTLQMVNDESQDFRESAAVCITSLLRRVSSETQLSLCEYAVRWSSSEGDLRRTGLQIFGIMVEACPDVLRKRNSFDKLVDSAREAMEDGTSWEVAYFAILTIEKVMAAFLESLTKRHDLWFAMVPTLRSEHPWVRLASARVLTAQLTRLDVESLDTSESFVSVKRGTLHELASAFCHQLTLCEDAGSSEAVRFTAKSITWLVIAMDRHRGLSTRDDESKDEKRDSVRWVLVRLANVARPKGSQRRQAVYSCFAAITASRPDVAENHLETILEPLHRSELEAQNEIEERGVGQRTRSPAESVTEELKLAQDVIHLLEERCDTNESFLTAYAAVKTRAKERKEKRKLEEKTEAIRDPHGAAKSRIEKQQRERNRRKRRVEECRLDRGAKAKRRHVDS